MSNALDRITFISSDDKEVEFEKDLIKSCLNFTEEAWGEGIVTQATEKTLKVFKRFLEIHLYEPKNANFQPEITSSDLKNHIDENSYLIFQKLDLEQIKDLLDLSEMFNCDMLRYVCLTIVQCMFFIDDKAKFIQKFKQENEIDEDFTEEEVQEIIEEHLLVLKEIMETYDTNNPNYKPKNFDNEDEEEEEEEEYDNNEDDLAQQLDQKLDLGDQQEQQEEQKKN